VSLLFFFPFFFYFFHFVRYARQILLGLAYLHSQQPPVAHRDVKSANVLVETTGNVKLADFGCSKVFSELLEGSVAFSSVLGTPHWMAPEVIRQEGAGLAADIWSFGCTVLEMATGHPPWHHIRDPTAVMFHVASTTELPLIPEALSAAGKDFLKLCFQRDAAKRPTAEELLMHPFVSTSGNSSSGASGTPGLSRKSAEDSSSEDVVSMYQSLMTASLVTMPQFLSVLPANLVVYIFTFLRDVDLCAVSRVCRAWRAAAGADSLWEVKVRTAWGWSPSPKGHSWHHMYVAGRMGHGWKQEGKMTLDTLRGHGKAVLCVEAHHDRLLTGGEDKKIRVWSVSRHKCLMTLRGHLKSVSALRSSESLLLSGSLDASLRLWDISGKGKMVRSMHCGGKSVSSVDMCGSVALSSSAEGIVRFWDVETGDVTLELRCDSPVQSVRMDTPQRAFFAAADGSLRVCDSRVKSETATLSGHVGPVHSVQLHRKKKSGARAFSVADLVVSGGSDGLVKLWDARTLKAYSSLSCGKDECIYSVDFDGNIIAAGGKSRTLNVFDIVTEERLRALSSHHSDVICGVSVGASSKVFSCSRDKTIRVLSPPNKGSSSGKVPRATPSLLRLTEMFHSSASDSEKN